MRMFLASMLAVLIASIAVGAEPDHKEAPIAAIAVTECGRAVVIFVTLDAAHVLRFDGKSAAVYEVKPDGTVGLSEGEPVPIEAAMKIATSARIQANAALPCHESEA